MVSGIVYKPIINQFLTVFYLPYTSKLTTLQIISLNLGKDTLSCTNFQKSEMEIGIKKLFNLLRNQDFRYFTPHNSPEGTFP